MRSQILRGCDFVLDFLREPDVEKLRLKIMALQLETGPKTIYDFKTLNGEIDVVANATAKKFCDQLE